MGSCNLNQNCRGRKPADCDPTLHCTLAFILQPRKIAKKYKD